MVGSEGPLLEKVRRVRGVTVILLKSLHREINLYYDVKAIFYIRRLLRKIKPDILHLHSSKAGTLGRIAAIGMPTKVVFTVHGWAFTDGIGLRTKKKVFQIVEKIVAPLTDLFICVSEYDYTIGLKEHVINDNCRAVVIHNGVPVPQIRKKGYSDLHKPLRLVMTARFSKQKDQKKLIGALKKLNAQFDFEMIFVGDGETLVENKILVKKLDLDNKVKFVGFKDDVIPYLISSDLYILSTHYEGLPISIIEAMSYALPIIATNVGGNKELVFDEKNGFLVNNEYELVDAIRYFFVHKSSIIEFGENSRKIVTADFNIKKMLEKINDEYNKLV